MRTWEGTNQITWNEERMEGKGIFTPGTVKYFKKLGGSIKNQFKMVAIWEL